MTRLNNNKKKLPKKIVPFFLLGLVTHIAMNKIEKTTKSKLLIKELKKLLVFCPFHKVIPK